MQSAATLDGTVLGDRYRVVRELGGGGMGTVYEVEHVDLGRPFALKVLRLGSRSDELEQRFRREARALAMVRSPRVAQVTDFGIDPVVGTWYVMELVAGESLEDRISREGALPPAVALPILAEVADALGDVHDAGLVHRDLKPSNIGLPARGPLRAQLLDFGLAASIDDAFLTRITQSQQVLGSLPYIAPESFSGARPSVAADLWAFGIVLYETLAGRLPFDAPSTAALMHAILTSPPPRVDAFPPPLAQLLGALLDKEPSRRPSSAREVAQRLRASERMSLPPTLALEEMPRTRAMPSAVPTPPGAHTQPLSVPPTADARGPVESSIRLSVEPTRTPRWLLWGTLALAVGVGSGVGVMLALDALSPSVPEVPEVDRAGVPEVPEVDRAGVPAAGAPEPSQLAPSAAPPAPPSTPPSQASTTAPPTAEPTPAEPTPAEPTPAEPTTAEPSDEGTTEAREAAGEAAASTGAAPEPRESRRVVRPQAERPTEARSRPSSLRETPPPEAGGSTDTTRPSGWRGGIIEDLE